MLSMQIIAVRKCIVLYLYSIISTLADQTIDLEEEVRSQM